MHKLKCDHCDHYNPLKSEYVIFCENCQKKITNNYKDWQLRFPNKNFNDFKSTVCFSDEQISSSIKQEKNNTSKIGIGIILIIIAISICAGVGSYVIYNMFKNGVKSINPSNLVNNLTSNNTHDTETWVDFTSEEAKFKASFPQKPLEQEQLMNSPIGEFPIKLQTHQAKLGTDVNVIYGTGYSANTISQINSETASKMELEIFYGMVVNSTCKLLQGKKISSKDYSINGHSGKEVQISLKQGSVTLTVHYILVKDRLLLQQVASVGSGEANPSSERFFNSFELL